MKKELQELGVKEDKEESDTDNSNSNIESDATRTNQEQCVKLKPLECEVIVRSVERESGDEGKEEVGEREIFPKKCGICGEEFSDKLAIVEHIRNNHITKTYTKSESTKPKFEIIRQKTSKCLDIIREETEKCN